MKACGSIRATLASNEIQKDFVQKVVERDYFIGNTLVDMYAKYGSLAEALVVFNKFSGPRTGILECIECRICWEWEIWGSAQSISSNEGSMDTHCLTQDRLGKDCHFLSIYFDFVVDMPF